jgi:hypothetical protein
MTEQRNNSNGIPLTNVNTQSTVTNQQHLTYNSSFDAHQMINMTLASMISKQMMTILNGPDGIGINKIMKLFAIMSLDQIRQGIMTIIKKIFSLIGDKYPLIFMYINKNIFNSIVVITLKNMIYQSIKLFKSYVWPTTIKPVELIEYIVLHDTPIINSIQIEINTTLSFVEILINHINNNTQSIINKTLYQTSSTKKIKIESHAKIIISESWYNININFEDVNIIVDSEIQLCFEKKKNKLILNNFKINNFQKNDLIDLNKITSIMDFVPDSDLKKWLIQNLNECIDFDKNKIILQSDGYRVDACYNKYNSIFSNNEYCCNNYFVSNLLEFLATKIPNLNMYRSMYELIILLYITGLSSKNFLYGRPIIINKLYIFNTSFDIDLENYNKYFKSSKSTFGTYGITGNHIFIDRINNLFKTKIDLIAFANIHYMSFLKFTTQPTQPISIITNDNIVLSINSDKYTKSELHNKVENFIKYINSYVEDDDIVKSTISYVIMIQTNEIINHIPNPKYIQYTKQKENIMEINELLKQSNKSDEKFNISRMEQSLINLSNIEVPPETIENITIEKKIVVKEISDKSKKFNSLYLRKSDKEKLLNILELFHENKELLAELGIPNKLGILLHGLYGTGKSSTIQAISTYLKKNIYCVDFQTIITNSDFSMVVEYVNTHCANGGILTFEDFDAMGSVLHRRGDNSAQKSVSNVDLLNSESNNLTLDYILNVFQGSLTPSGFIFIATTNHLEKLDEALYRDGRFDIKIEMKLCDHYQIKCIYAHLIKREIPNDILLQIEEDKWTPANIIFRLINYVKGNHTDENILSPFIKT